MKLVPIKQDGTCEVSGFQDSPGAEEACIHQANYYAKSGYVEPWTGYLIIDNNMIIGICSFKGAPRDGRVEIAYFIFPEFEEMGFATRAAKALMDIAMVTDPSLVVTARTLPQKNASTRILEKNGFKLAGPVQDPEDGEVWEWFYPAG